MAQLAARGSTYPAVITASIAVILGIWTLYALSAARVIRRLPFLRLALVLIAAIYLTRGVLGVPVVLWGEDPYAKELKAKMTFMILSSMVCVFIGLCYAVGATSVWRRFSARSRP